MLQIASLLSMTMILALMLAAATDFVAVADKPTDAAVADLNGDRRS